MLMLEKLILENGFTYRSFIGVNMTSEHHVNAVLHEPWLEHYSHGLAFHVMIVVAIIPRRMHKNNQPWRFTSVHFR